MKTAVKNAKTVQTAGTNNNNAPRVDNRPNIPGNAKNDDPAKDQQSAEAKETTASQATQNPAVPAPAVDHQPANTTAPEVKAEAAQEQKATEPHAGEHKGEIKYIKPAQNLEQTLKTVGNLHRLTIQRLALLARIKTLEEFEVKLVEENDQLENNPYMGCKLTIKDDKGREFVTNTPNLIRMVTQFIFDACHEKLADIEANIVFPYAG